MTSMSALPLVPCTPSPRNTYALSECPAAPGNLICLCMACTGNTRQAPYAELFIRRASSNFEIREPFQHAFRRDRCAVHPYS